VVWVQVVAWEQVVVHGELELADDVELELADNVELELVDDVERVVNMFVVVVGQVVV